MASCAAGAAAVKRVDAVEQRPAAEPDGDRSRLGDGLGGRRRATHGGEELGVVEKPVGEVVRSADRANRLNRRHELISGVGGVLRGGETGADQQRFGALHRCELSGPLPIADVEELSLGGEITELVGTAGGQRPRPASVVSGERERSLDVLQGAAAPPQRLDEIVACRRDERTRRGHGREILGVLARRQVAQLAEQLLGGVRLAAKRREPGARRDDGLVVGDQVPVGVTVHHVVGLVPVTGRARGPARGW